MVNIASPHIAGYTLVGKANGTKLIYDSLCQFLGSVPVWKPNLPAVENGIIEVETSESIEIILNNIFTKIYQIQNDTELLKASLDLTQIERGKYFDRLRKNYNLRREFSNYSIKLNPYQNNIAEILKVLNFQIVN
jgi:erythronate-4-phosphate dehydrogenase